MVGPAYYDSSTDSFDVDGLHDHKQGIKYLGKAKKDEYGRWTCIAIVDGLGLCRVQINIEPQEVALEP